MASRRKKAAVSTGAALAGIALVGGLIWLGTRDDAPDEKPVDDTKPDKTPVDKPDEPQPPPPTPPAPPVIVGSWCSTVPSAGAPPMLDAAVSAWVLAQPEPRLVYLWLALSLYVTKWTSELPTVDSLKDDTDRTNGFSPQTQAAMERLLVGRTVGENKQRDVIDAFRAFLARDTAKDSPCPVSVTPELGAMLQNWVDDVAIAAERMEL